MTHLIFYDGECGLCDAVVQWVLKKDKHKKFVFAPLQGETAKQWLPQPPEIDSVYLIQNFSDKMPKVYVKSQAAFKILWELGGIFSVPGLFSFLPPFLFDWGYDLVASHRKKWFPPISCVIPNKDNKRFLP